MRNADTNWTALLEAIGRADLVKLLLAAGAKVNVAIRNENDVLTGVTPLMLAAGEGFEDVVQLLLENGADVNATTRPTGISALSRAKLLGAEDNRGVIRRLEAAGVKK